MNNEPPTLLEIAAQLIKQGWPAFLALREAADRLAVLQQATQIHQITARLHSVLGEG